MGRRHGRALPRRRPAQLGRQRDLRHRRPEDGVPQLLQAAGRPDEPGELRRPQRVARAGTRPRRDEPGLVPGRHLGVRLHRLGEPEGARVLRPRADQCRRRSSSAALVRLLVQRLPLRDGDRPRLRRLRADADGGALRERDRGRGRAEVRAVQRAAPTPDQVGPSYALVRAYRDQGVRPGAIDAATLAQIDKFVDRAEKFSEGRRRAPLRRSCTLWRISSTATSTRRSARRCGPCPTRRRRTSRSTCRPSRREAAVPHGPAASAGGRAGHRRDRSAD